MSRKAEEREVGKTKLTNRDIAIYALYRLGGAEERVGTEKVAMECYRLAPDRFSWKLYPEYPDSEPGRSALFDAQKAENGRLVRGSKPKGWMLTPAGIDRIRMLLPQLERIGVGEAQETSDRQLIQRYMNELEKHHAYQEFLRTGDCEAVKEYEFTDFLRCGVDSGPRVIRDRLESVKTRAYDAGRNGILEFLELCEKRFADMLASK